MKRYDVILEKNDDNYLFELDYGTEYKVFCDINKNNEVYISLGKSYDNVKKDIENEIILPIFGLIPNGIYNPDSVFIDKAYKKAEEFYIKKTKELDEKEHDVVIKENSNMKVWKYTSFVNKEANTVSYYLHEDDVAILINNDGTFLPIIGINNHAITKQEEYEKQQVLLQFIEDKLDVIISLKDKNKKNKMLIDNALEDSLNSEVKYKDSDIIINTVGEKK